MHSKTEATHKHPHAMFSLVSIGYNILQIHALQSGAQLFSLHQHVPVRTLQIMLQHVVCTIPS